MQEPSTNIGTGYPTDIVTVRKITQLNKNKTPNIDMDITAMTDWHTSNIWQYLNQKKINV